MKGVLKMFQTILLLSSICVLARSSGVGHGHSPPIVPIANAPVVTAASSQYFERTFNRLVVPQVVAPVAPVAPPPFQPIFPIAAAPVAPAPPVFVEPARTVPVAVNPSPPQEAPVQPNIAIAVATAHAAAPVATILLPPYPFGFPPTIGFIPPEQPVNVPDENNKEPTTQSTTQAEVTTTTLEPEATTPISSSSDDNFVQALPSNENINFNQYGPPTPPLSNNPQFQPQPEQPRPQFQPQPQQPRPQFQPQSQQPRPQFQSQPQQPRPQYQPQPQQPRPQIQTQPQLPRPQFLPQAQQPHPQFQLQPQQPHLQYQPQPQQPRPPFQQQPQYQPLPRPQFKGRPQQPWPQNKVKPQKLKTSIEVVPVPLAYIAPPSEKLLHHHHHHHHHHGQVKVVKHVYSFVPVSSSKIILREVPARLVAYKSNSNVRANLKDVELTTYSPIPRPNNKPPRLW